MSKITFKKIKGFQYKYEIYIDDKLEGELSSFTGTSWRYICDRFFWDQTIGGLIKDVKETLKKYIKFELHLENFKEVFGDDFLER